MARLFDPWDDAALIVGRLRAPGSRLIVVIGAEQWCDKCRQLKPVFEALAEQANGHEVMLWLDLEDHQEFIGSYIPADLPELQVYEQERLTNCQVVEDLSVAGLQQLLRNSACTSTLTQDLDIVRRLLQPDWASQSESK